MGWHAQSRLWPLYQQDLDFLSAPHPTPLLAPHPSPPRAASTLALARLLALFSALSLKTPKSTHCPQCNLQSSLFRAPVPPVPSFQCCEKSTPFPQSGFISYYFFMGISLVTACPPLTSTGDLPSSGLFSSVNPKRANQVCPPQTTLFSEALFKLPRYLSPGLLTLF